MLRKVFLNRNTVIKGLPSLYRTPSRWQTTQVQSHEDEASETTPYESDKKEKIEPFVKNLFLGKYDTSVLIFPQALDKERLDTLNAMVEPVDKYFNEDLDSASMDRNANIPEDVLNKLRELGLFGIQVPEKYGGLGLGATEFSRLSEFIALDGGVMTTLAAHQSIGYKGLLLAGSEYLKEKYLHKCASGEYIAAFCLTEPGSGSDAQSIQTRATLADDGKTWLLNGNKVWISNGGIADVMTVFARTEIEKDGKKMDKITAFFVERDFGGITSGKPEDKMGIRCSNTTEVTFDNTPVPSENIIGELGHGFKLAVTILNSGRFSMGAASAGVLRKGMAWTLDYALTRKQFGHSLADFGLIKQKFAQAAVTTYAMESMSYLAAGIMDTHKQYDTAVEAAIVKVFSSSNAWVLGSELLQVMGGLGYMRNLPFERFLRDCRITLIFEGTNEILRMFVALMGIQHAAPELKSTVKKLRNPFMYPGFVMSAAMRQLRDTQDKPSLPHDLAGHVHPSLKDGADALEYCVERFRYAVQLVLTKYGAEVVSPNHQMDVVRLADIVIDLFAMTSVLSRASRSYCDGIHNAEHEVLLALTFCREAEGRVRKLIGEVQYNSETNDEAYTQIVDSMIAKGGYAASHPLTINLM